MQTYEIPQNCPFSLPFPTVIAFHRVKKSPLIIGIVDRIKINSEQPLPFSESELSVPYFLQIVHINYVCFVYFAAIAQVCINLHRQHVMFFIQRWCERGSKSHGVQLNVVGRGCGNQGVGDIRFINIFTTFFYLFLFFNYTIFLYFFYPRHLTTPTPTTHDLYPRPTTHDIQLHSLMQS